MSNIERVYHFARLIYKTRVVFGRTVAVLAHKATGEDGGIKYLLLPARLVKWLRQVEAGLLGAGVVPVQNLASRFVENAVLAGEDFDGVDGGLDTFIGATIAAIEGVIVLEAGATLAASKKHGQRGARLFPSWATRSLFYCIDTPFEKLPKDSPALIGAGALAALVVDVMLTEREGDLLEVGLDVDTDDGHLHPDTEEGEACS